MNDENFCLEPRDCKKSYLSGVQVVPMFISLLTHKLIEKECPDKLNLKSNFSGGLYTADLRKSFILPIGISLENKFACYTI